jgi:hypothetical protein
MKMFRSCQQMGMIKLIGCVLKNRAKFKHNSCARVSASGSLSVDPRIAKDGRLARIWPSSVGFSRPQKALL